MSSSDHVVADDVPAPPAVVRDFYADLNNIVAVHPLVVSVEVTDRAKSAEGHTTTYRVRDRIPFGPFKLTVAYMAKVYVPDHGDLLTEAHQFPRVRVRGRVSFDETNTGTRITERLAIDAPRPLAAVTVSEAVRAHAQMLDGIRRCLA